MTSHSSQVRVDGGSVVRLAGEFDLANVDALREHLERASECPDAIVCLDLAEVTFLDSSAIHAIAAAVRRVPNGCVIAHEAPPSVLRLFSIVGLDRWPSVHIV